MSSLIEPVFSGPRKILRQAREVLAAAHIDSRPTVPRRANGLLKVSREQAEPARTLLARWNSPEGRVLSAAEAAFFFCPACHAALSDGALRCAACGEFVGDPHAL
jgi:hypothetical protein